MPQTLAKAVDVGLKPVEDYVFEVVLSFQEGSSEVVIKGRGQSISKAVDVYNAVVDRLGEGVELAGVEIGSEEFKGRLRSYIAIRLRRRY
ncbi:MAG: DNA-binding protein [Desulfurococcaceae archaeon]